MDLNCKYIVIGAGFFGAVIAERIASVLNENVLILEKRNHLGGNSYSEIYKGTDIECHQYGSHIFHTNNKVVWEYLNQFTQFNQYKHKVIANIDDQLFSLPINRKTLNQYFKINLKSEVEAEQLLISLKKNISDPKNFEEKAIGLIGEKLYEAFFKGYTSKQWGTDPKLLPHETFSRLPVRFNENDYYFDDPYEGIPLCGYGELFKKILNNKKIRVEYNADYFLLRDQIKSDSRVIYSGPIDQFFNYKFGHLGWRTLRFEKEIVSKTFFQSNSVVNYPHQKVPYTRIHEFKYYHPERKTDDHQTVIFKEFSKKCENDETPYYPINTVDDKKIYTQYENEAKNLKNVIIGGRLGAYKYFDMHHVIAMALKVFDERILNSK